MVITYISSLLVALVVVFVVVVVAIILVVVVAVPTPLGPQPLIQKGYVDVVVLVVAISLRHDIVLVAVVVDKGDDGEEEEEEDADGGEDGITMVAGCGVID